MAGRQSISIRGIRPQIIDENERRSFPPPLFIHKRRVTFYQSIPPEQFLLRLTVNVSNALVNLSLGGFLYDRDKELSYDPLGAHFVSNQIRPCPCQLG